MSRPGTGPSRRRRLLRVGVALLGTDLGVRFGSRTRVQVGPLRAEARLVTDPAAGTAVHVPPLGDAHLNTHGGLLRLDATVDGIDEASAVALVKKPGKLDVDVERALKAGLVKLGIRSAVGGIAGAAVASALTERSTPRAAAGGLIGAGALAVNAGVAFASARLDAWQSPRLSGLLARAPGLVGDVRRIPEELDRYGTQLAEIGASVTGVYRGLTSLPGAPPKSAIRIVWLSDVHNNPLAFTIASSLVEQYEAACVVDTGDIADWGTSHEARTFAGIAQIPVPYVFIKGNHDGPDTLKELRKFDNVVILDAGEATELTGLRIVGAADPRFTPDKSTGDDDFDKARLAAIGVELAAKIRPKNADIALVHDPVVAAQLGGAVPLVLCGHTHKRNDRRVDGTLVLTHGSSGGAGLRGVRQDPPDSLAISVLHIDATSRRLHSIDELTFGGLGLTRASLVRRTAGELGEPRTSRQKTG